MNCPLCSSNLWSTGVKLSTLPATEIYVCSKQCGITAGRVEYDDGAVRWRFFASTGEEIGVA